MRKLNFLITVLCVLTTLSFSAFSQVLLTEDFETDGEGTRYTSNFFYTGTSDFFTRMDNDPVMYALGNGTGVHPTNPSGSFYWGAEDCDAAVGGEGLLTLDPLTVTGYNLEVDVLIANGRPNDFRLETDDYFILEYNMDAAGWNAFGAMHGNTGTGSGNLQGDANFDGLPDAGGFEINSSDFINVNYSIPVTGSSVQVRLRVLVNTGTESIIFDNIRVTGTSFLPVELVNFNAIKADSEVELSWQTATELNNEGFNVLHSTDGEAWNTIEFVPGVGTTTEMNAYQILHRNPSQGMNYYRLQQVDIDGKTSFSNVRSVRFDMKHALSIVPNPSNGEFFVNINTDLFQNNSVVQVTDLKGILMVASRNSIDLNNTVLIDGSNWSSGIYFVRVTDGVTTMTKRMVIR